MNDQAASLEFKGGMKTASLPVLMFIGFCILFFVILKAFEMHALAMGALLSLLFSAFFVKRGQYDRYWQAVYEGAQEAIPVVILLLMIGMFSQLIKVSDLSNGFVWLASQMDIHSSLFTAVTFVFVAIIATATGSSIGSFFTCFPIFYPAGVLLGSQPAALAAAIVCGGIFGDNLAPISDTTIISSASQTYKNRKGRADIGGCVRSRLKYALIAGALAFILYLLFGGTGQGPLREQEFFTEQMSPRSLLMLLPVGLMLVISIVKKNIYYAISWGLIIGTALALWSGILTPHDVIAVEEGMPVGFLAEGVHAMMGTCILVLSVYGIMGVIHSAGVLDRLTDWIYQSNLGKTARGAEFAMMIGITLTTILFGGVTSASITTFGKVQNNLGQRLDLHPYRRANLLDGFANALGVCVPFLSVFVFIGSQLTMSYDFVEAVSVTQLSLYLFHSYALFLVLFISVLTGWGREFEGPQGEVVKAD